MGILKSSAEPRYIYNTKSQRDIDRDHLIGSNIKTVLPKFMAGKYDELIQNFHTKFRQGTTSKYNSYGRTLKDKYFPIELILTPLPSIGQGLNVVSYVRKLAKSVSIMIVDFNGKVVECSRDLQALLNHEKKEGYRDLANICADLVTANQAFNIVYAPELQSLAPTQNEVNMLSEDDSTYIQPKSPHNIKSEENRLLSASDALSSRLFPVKPTKDTEGASKFLRIGNHSEKENETKDIPPVLPRNRSESMNAMSREEAEAICEVYKGKKTLKFIPPPSPLGLKNLAEISFESQIEPFFFGGSMYKIIKVSKPKEQSKELAPKPKAKEVKPSVLLSETKIKSLEKLVSSFAQGDNDVPVASEVEIANHPPTDNSEKEEKEDQDKDKDSNQLVILQLHTARSISKKSKANSVINSVASVRNKVSRMSTFFRNPRLSYATKVASVMVFLSMLVVLASACINMTFTRQALHDIDNAVGLINFTNERLYKLVAAWRAALVVYTRAVQLRPSNPTLVAQYQAVVKSSTIDMLNANNLLQMRINDFKNDGITRDFFEKQVSLWVPYENRILDNQEVDSFAASQIISMNNMFIANWKGSVLDLKGRSEVLFALNNTVNDYLVAVGDSISDVNNFFEKTQSNNNKLLTAIIVLENLALIIPFISLRALFKIVFNGHKDLFKAISKIRKSNVEERLNRLNKITDYLKEDVEDSLVFFQDHISAELERVKPTIKADKKNEMSFTRIYTLKGLILNMSKYFVFTFILIAVILILFWLSFSSSIKGLNDLHRINQQLVKTYEFGEEISLIFPSFFFLLMFLNKPEFKIRNADPTVQLRRSIDYLSRANAELLSLSSLPGEGIEDLEIQNLLKNNLCPYVPLAHVQLCNTNTQLGSVGLLAIDSQYYQGYGLPVLNFMNTNASDLTAGVNLFNAIGKTFGDLHDVSHDGFEALANLFYSNFQNSVTEKLANNITYFQYTLAVIIVSMVLIKIVVINKYQELELAVFKIMKLVPYNVIERNKAIAFYLSKKFADEFSGMAANAQ